MTDFISIPSNPPPEGAQAFMFETPDGAPMRGAFFPAPEARGTVVLAPGWSEFMEKYFETITRLHERNLNVAMMDWRGQGLSDRERCKESNWNDFFEQLRDDLRYFTDERVKPHLPGPYFLMTHSMGGLPGLMLLATGYDGFERASLCAPMTRLFAGSTNAFFSGAATLFCALGLSKTPTGKRDDDSMRFEGNMFTTDEKRHERFRQLKLTEPKAANGAPTFGWLRAAMKSSRDIRQPGYFDDLKIPVLILTAGAERRIDGTDHATIAGLSDKIDNKVIPGALHEIMMERDEIQERYWAAVDGFLKPALTR